jgi:hypothetical protein
MAGLMRGPLATRARLRFLAPGSLAAALIALSFLGPGAAAAAPEPVVCGEPVPIAVTIEDAAGQAISDHTLVEFTINHGGIVAAFSYYNPPARPLASAVAETFAGIATATLLTSTEHIGTYEVLVAVRSGYRFPAHGAPVVAQVTIDCYQR